MSSCRVHLRTLSPVRIGWPAPKHGDGMIVIGLRAYVVDPYRLALELERRGLLEAYIEYAGPGGNYLLGVEDITNWQTFLSRLHQAGTAAEPSPGKRIWELLPNSIRDTISRTAGTRRASPQPEDTSAVINALNTSVLSNTGLYDADNFAEVDLKRKERCLLGLRTPRTPEQTRELNRSLLMSSYRNLLKRSSEGLTGFLEANLPGAEVEALARAVASGVVHAGRAGGFIQNGVGRYMIPGSSVKGCLRTAVVFHMLERIGMTDPDKYEEFLPRSAASKARNFWRLSGRKRVNDQRTFSKGMVGALLGPEPHQDLFRAVRIPDIELPDNSVRDERAVVYCIQGRSLRRSRTADRPIPCQCIIENTEIEFRLDVNLTLLSRLAAELGVETPFNDAAGLVTLGTEFAARVWAHERAEWQGLTGENPGGIPDFYGENSDPVLRLGWGTGMTGTTVILLLDQALRTALRNVSAGRDKGGAGPRSRRLIERNQRLEAPLGWMLVTSVEAL